ncbi:ferredoxin Fer [Halobaculum sp. MBLA0147]|uniref:ferredoxin Fer n=1 Tax=Halobaculum sp. MBLA0147 TaxID=3079934 RepID=UPI0035248BF4
MASPYEVLGVDPDADEAEIDRAYRRRVIETHPDQGGSVSEFRVVKSAYEEIQAGTEPALDEPDGDANGTVGDENGTAERDEDAGATATETSERGSGASASAEPRSRADEPGSRADWRRRSRAGDTETEADPQVGTTVSYLDYEAVVDRGWSLDDDPFETAATAELDDETFGRFYAEPKETLLEAAEERGYAWPFACRGGACANCAVMVVEGEMATPNDHILSDDLVDRGFQLSCIASPVTEELKVLFNVKRIPELEELLLPADRFDRRHQD